MARITRSKSALSLDGGDLQALEKELFRMVENIGRVEKRRQIIEPAGEILKEEAKRLAPKGKRTHYRYDTAKVSRGLKAPNGLGNRVATYFRGNLRNAITDIANRKKKYRTFRVIIGPFYRGRSLKSGQYGSTEKNADGYYAHMVFGSSKAFKREVTGKALTNKRGVIINSIRSELLKFFRQETSKGKYLNLK